MIRLWNMVKEDRNYREAIARQAEEDSNAYGQGYRSIATRIKNSVAIVSDVNTDAGSDMFMLSSYLAHSLEDVYRMIDAIDIPDSAKLILANAVKDVEEAPSRFAEARKIQQVEESVRRFRAARARREEMSKMQEDAFGTITDSRSGDFTDTTMLVSDLGDDDEPA